MEEGCGHDAERDVGGASDARGGVTSLVLVGRGETVRAPLLSEPPGEGWGGIGWPYIAPYGCMAAR